MLERSNGWDPLSCPTTACTSKLGLLQWEGGRDGAWADLADDNCNVRAWGSWGELSQENVHLSLSAYFRGAWVTDLGETQDLVKVIPNPNNWWLWLYNLPSARLLEFELRTQALVWQTLLNPSVKMQSQLWRVCACSFTYVHPWETELCA